MASKCSLGLNVRVKDFRNLIANYSNYLDNNHNMQYEDKDDKKKCEIFEITDSKTDFISGLKLTGCGDHYYPLCKNRKKDNTIGSDSLWNRIPVSGSNTKYKDDMNNKIKIDKWLLYVESRGAKLYYKLNDHQIETINQGEKELIATNERIFSNLKDSFK